MSERESQNEKNWDKSLYEYIKKNKLVFKY